MCELCGRPTSPRGGDGGPASQPPVSPRRQARPSPSRLVRSRLRIGRRRRRRAWGRGPGDGSRSANRPPPQLLCFARPPAVVKMKPRRVGLQSPISSRPEFVRVHKHSSVSTNKSDTDPTPLCCDALCDARKLPARNIRSFRSRKTNTKSEARV